MRITLRTDGPCREWHRRLGERLVREGHDLRLETVPVRCPMPSALPLLLAAERGLYGATSPLLERADGLAAAATTAGELDLEVHFDGASGEGALVAALLARRVPRIDICEFVSGETARTLASGLPAIERPDVLAAALDMVLARTIQLVARAVRGVTGEVPPLALPEPGGSHGAASPARFFVRTLLHKMAGRMGGEQEGWRIAVRRVEDADGSSAQAWTSDRFVLLPNDGKAFHADPFLCSYNGRTCLFYEEFPYRTRKGVIAMVELAASGEVSPPRRVLEHDAHLSYPFIFVHEDAVYMLPEMSGARRVQLFRADPFPDRWVPDRVLVEDVVAADATLVAHGGRWWLFAAQSGDGGSSWDALSLFHAPGPLGPWTPHAGNPVLIDAGAARPAGAMWHAAGGQLMRVAQDCRSGYGSGMAICRVDRLDPDGYAQTVVSHLEPPAGFVADRIHTLNRHNGFEAIDVHLSSRRRVGQATG